LQESIDVKQQLLDNKLVKIVAQIATEIVATYRRGGKVLLFGNGGSAADAQHIAGELVGRFMKERTGLPAIALTTNTSILTAVANDYGYDKVFIRQLEALGGPSDLAIGISTSGNAENVNQAIEFAKKNGMKTIGLTGGTGGKLAMLVDTCLCIPSNNTQRIQEAHITVGHILCELVEEELAKH
ncbi:MAG: SIS domain-containing protein, partial [bacterium]|nr:SIS domain-containing protein [bacterium]